MARVTIFNHAVLTSVKEEMKRRRIEKRSQSARSSEQRVAYT